MAISRKEATLNWRVKNMASYKTYQQTYQAQNRWKYKEQGKAASRKWHSLQAELKRQRMIGMW